jgi:Flp pilus assembly protein TadD
MVLIKTTYRYLTVFVIAALFAGCSTVPNTASPTEDRSAGTSRAETPIYTPAPAHKRNAKPQRDSQLISQDQQDQPTPRIQQVVPVPSSSNQVRPSNPAVMALLGNAASQQNQGDIYAAQTSVQRAQRISPNDPNVYYALATIHRDLNDYVLAEQVALKGVSIVRGQAKQLQRFWLLIAEIRQRAGNITGSKQAQKQAQKY